MLYRVKESVAPDKLNVRCTPAGDIVGQLLPGALIEVDESFQPTSPKAVGWSRTLFTISDDETFKEMGVVALFVKTEFIELVPEPEPEPEPPPPPAPISPVQPRYFGVNVHIGQNANATVDLYRDMRQAGHPLGVALVINNVDIANRIKEVSPTTFVILRLGVIGGQDMLPLIEGDAEANRRSGRLRFLERYKPSAADCYQIANEHYHKSHSQLRIVGMADFYCGAMDAAREKNTLITIGDFSVGTPEDYHLPLMSKMFKQAERDGHPLDYHFYTAPGKESDITFEADLYALRWKVISKLYPALRIVGGEAGGFKRNPDDLVGLMKQLWALVYGERNLIGMNLFTANPARDWIDNGFNVDPHFPALKQWWLG